MMSLMLCLFQEYIYIYIYTYTLHIAQNTWALWVEKSTGKWEVLFSLLKPLP